MSDMTQAMRQQPAAPLCAHGSKTQLTNVPTSNDKADLCHNATNYNDNKVTKMRMPVCMRIHTHEPTTAVLMKHSMAN